MLMSHSGDWNGFVIRRLNRSSVLASRAYHTHGSGEGIISKASMLN